MKCTTSTCIVRLNSYFVSKRRSLRNFIDYSIRSIIDFIYICNIDVTCYCFFSYIDIIKYRRPLNLEVTGIVFIVNFPSHDSPNIDDNRTSLFVNKLFDYHVILNLWLLQRYKLLMMHCSHTIKTHIKRYVVKDRTDCSIKQIRAKLKFGISQLQTLRRRHGIL